jgi:hypothetical protein
MKNNKSVLLQQFAAEIGKMKYHQGRVPWQPDRVHLPSGQMVPIEHLKAAETYEAIANLFAAGEGYYPALFELRDFYVKCARSTIGVIDRVRKL